MKTTFFKPRLDDFMALNATPVSEEVLSAEDFLKLAKTNPGLIKSSRIVMPVPGRSSLGEFAVQYRYPRFKTA